MSGIGASLENLDKGVRKSVPGGWVTVAGLAAGGAGAAGAFSGLGAGAAGAAGGTAAGTGVGAGAGAAGGLSAGAVGGSGALATQSALGLGGSAIGMAAPSAMATPAAFGTLAGAGSATGVGTAMQASGLSLASGAASPFQISPMQAMMANKALGGFGQQQPSGETRTSAPFRAGQPVNTADPILALLAPKMKKKQPISLL